MERCGDDSDHGGARDEGPGDNGAGRMLARGSSWRFPKGLILSFHPSIVSIPGSGRC